MEFIEIFKLINKAKVNTSDVLYFEYGNKKYILLGESHDGKKSGIMNDIINHFKEPTMHAMELSIQANEFAVEHVLKKLKEDAAKSEKDDSYIVLNAINYIEENLSLNPLKRAKQMKMTLKDFSKKNKNKLRFIDTRLIKNYPKVPLTTETAKRLIPNAVQHGRELLKTIERLEDDPKTRDIRNYIYDKISEVLFKLQKEWKATEDQPKDLQYTALPYLDVTILSRFLLEPNFEEEYVYAILGNNHVRHFFKEYIYHMDVKNVYLNGEKLQVGGRMKKTKKKSSKKSVKKSSKKSESKKKLFLKDYKEIKAYRKKNKNAPVDILGAKEMKYSSDKKIRKYQILVGIILATQTRDEVTHKVYNKILPQLTPQKISKISQPDLLKMIYSVNYNKRKAKQIKELTDVLIKKYNSDVPEDYKEITKLPGVGKKIGTLAINIFTDKTIGIPVDVNMHKLANKRGWVSTKTPDQTKKELEKIVPKKYWSEINGVLIGYVQLQNNRGM